ncbi:flagellar protein FlaG [Salimicrobium halophilum]|uniref:Flagellar protein FlaG n=1 Tax=Salimicrobium halophilum TaxID=86666 RepID=A0A1G8V3I8_9BACI|nr:flagellar protein FlaG [Salimicrobium halophilum]SDJ60427.1 flagellar protein FlaG [Salimicrobium halophilum]
MKIEQMLTQSQLLQSQQQTGANTKAVQKKPEDEARTIEVGQEVSPENVRDAVEGMNEFLKPVHTSLKFEMHEKLEEYYVKVIDSNTEEVIKEIPSEKMLDMYAMMAEQLGFLVDQKI